MYMSHSDSTSHSLSGNFLADVWSHMPLCHPEFLLGMRKIVLDEELEEEELLENIRTAVGSGLASGDNGKTADTPPLPAEETVPPET